MLPFFGYVYFNGLKSKISYIWQQGELYREKNYITQAENITNATIKLL